jgi:hypothetical protein
MLRKSQFKLNSSYPLMLNYSFIIKFKKKSIHLLNLQTTINDMTMLDKDKKKNH